MTTLAIVNHCAPYAGQAGQESTDLALAAGSFGQQVSVFFVNDGVFQLIAQQTPEQLQRKHFTKSFGAFEFYDIEHIYVCRTSLEKRGLSVTELAVEVTVLDSTTFNHTLLQHQHIVNMT
ncbi:sulfurtransferase complex subunit TusC [Aliiglaciecola litoralis]|uniref:Sulfurtransferase complex subunit TusC n=1 Tax=Aliiglaciecola litoralis TaxID=582857 RepID=A0ABN1LC28_9ALTE